MTSRGHTAAAVVDAPVDVVTAAPPQPQQCARPGSKLPREVVTWLQSLPIPRGAVAAVRNPKRDLSNGERVGEICACYWRDVPLHSLSNQLSRAHKQANWRVLAKLFARHGAPLSDAMIDGMIEAKDGQFAEVFLLQLYSLLTGKPLKPPLPKEELALPPAVKSSPTPYRPPHVLTATGAHTAPTGEDDRWGSCDDLLFSSAAGEDADHINNDTVADKEEQQRLRQQFHAQQQRQRPSLGGAGGSETTLAPLSPSLPSVGLAERQPRQRPDSGAMRATQGGPGGGGADADALDADGRVKMKFNIIVRPAAQASTVVGGRPRPPRPAEKEHPTAERRNSAGGKSAALPPTAAVPCPARVQWADGLVVDGSLCPDVARWLAALLASAAAAAGGNEDTNRARGDDGADEDRSLQIVQFFLCVAQRPRWGEPAWRVLHGQQSRLAAHARADSTAFAQLVEVLLRVPLQLAVHSRRTPPVEGGRAVGVPPEAFACLAAVLASLAALDPYRASTILRSAVIHNTKLMHLCVALHADSDVATGLASLLLAVSRASAAQAAARQVADAVSALSDELFTGAAHPADEATALFLLVLRAATCQCNAHASGNSTAAHAPSSPSVRPPLTGQGGGGAPTPPPAASARADETTALTEWLHDISRAHAARALASAEGSSPHRRLAGAWLAVGLLQTANRHDPRKAVALVGEFGPLLTPPPECLPADGSDVAGSANASALVYAVVFAMWVRAAAHATLVSSAVEEHVVHMCAWLRSAPVPSRDSCTDKHPIAQAATVVAAELAGLLGDLGRSGLDSPPPSVADSSSTGGGGGGTACASLVADAVVEYFAHRAADDVARAVLSPASAASLAARWVAPVVGPLPVAADVLVRSDALLLTEALARRLPGQGADGTSLAARKEFPPATAMAAAALQRRVATMAAALVRDGCHVPARTAQRLRWLYAFNRSVPHDAGDGSHPGAPAQPRGSVNRGGATLRDGGAREQPQQHEQRWRAVWLDFYEDVTLVVAAAELLLTRQQQAGSRRRSAGAEGGREASAARTELLSLAAMAQRTTVVWFATTGAQQRQSQGTSRDESVAAMPNEGEEASALLTEAMEWFRNVIVPTT